MATKRYEERRDFILNWLKNDVSGGCDVLNTDFVNDYLVFTGAGAYLQPYGAHKCPMLGRDLARMFKEYKLSRCRIGVRGMAGMSFPRWVYSYTISPRYKLLLEELANSGRGE